MGGTIPNPGAKRFADMAGAFLAVTLPLWSQEGQFVIRVKDLTGAAMPYAEVTVGDRKVKADEGGIASLSGLPAGRHEVRVQVAGFRIWRGVYPISSGVPAKVDAVLEVSTFGGDPVRAKRSAPGSQRPGKVKLTARDASGGVVAGADVLLVSEAGLAWHGRTDGDGEVVLGDVEAGEVKVSVEREGFAAWRETRAVRGDERIEVQLMLRGQDAKVDVKESAGRRFWNWLSSCTRK